MSRVFCYIANESLPLEPALAPIKAHILGEGAGTDDAARRGEGCGVGYYDGNDVLLQKWPSVDPRRFDLFGELSRLRTHCTLVHRRIPTSGALKPENTHPFRFRSWLFAHHGDIPDFEKIREPLFDELPDSLRQIVTGATDSEALFAVLLAFMHHDGGIDDPSIEPKALGEYMRASIWKVKSLLDSAGVDLNAAPPILDMLLTNGRCVVGVCSGRPMHYTLREGVDRDPRDFDRGPSAGRARAVVITAGGNGEQAPGWISVPENSVIAVNRELHVEISSI